jgi:hypothetical protein
MCNSALDGFDFRDCFTLDLRFEEFLHVTATFEHQDGDLDLRLYDSDFSLVSFSQTETDDESLSFAAPDNASFIVCVEPVGPAFSSLYTLDIMIEEPSLECFEDANEALGDDNCVLAEDSLQPYPVGEDVQHDGRTLCEGDEDFVAIRFRFGQELYAVLSRTNGVAAIDVELLLNDCETILAQSEGFGDLRTLEFSADLDAVLFLRVFSEDPLLTADYDLTIRVDAGNFVCPEDLVQGVPAEPNDEPDQATVVSFERESLWEADDLYACNEDEDWYSVLIEVSSDVLRATLNQSIDDPALSVGIYDVDGTTVLDENRDILGRKTVESVPLADPGQYYVRVRGVGDLPISGVNYDLSVLVFPDETCLDDIYEPNDTFENNTRVGDGEFLATMCRGGGNELDFYSLGLEAGDQVEITLEYNHARISPLDALPTVLYGPGGGQDFRDFTIRDGFTDRDVFSAGSFFVTEFDEGTWYIEVGAGDRGRYVNYTLNIEVINAFCDAEADLFEPNEDCEVAWAIEFDEPIDGYVCGPTGDVDWFAVTPDEGQTLSVHIDYFHFDGDIDLQVYESGSNTLVGGSYNIGPNFEDVEVEGTNAETYCIRVYTPGALTGNDYTLTVNAE